MSYDKGMRINYRFPQLVGYCLHNEGFMQQIEHGIPKGQWSFWWNGGHRDLNLGKSPTLAEIKNAMALYAITELIAKRDELAEKLAEVTAALATADIDGDWIENYRDDRQK